MTDQECVQFLKSALPQLRMRWNGFRRVRGQVCKRIVRRLQELGLPDAAAYRSFLESTRDEWGVLDSLCRVTISRFYRDREVFQALEQDVLLRLCEAALARGEEELRCWSAGCASGEEAYTLALLWDLVLGRRFPSLKITIIATDADSTMISRAREGRYAPGSLRNLPQEWKGALAREGDLFRIRSGQREKAFFLEQDIRSTEPGGSFHLILCRNMVFTYFDRELQKDILGRLHAKLLAGAALVIGTHEALPPDTSGFLPWPGCRGVYRKTEVDRVGQAITEIVQKNNR
jgi:chemotaxis protein methyltransferase CheR